MASDDEERIANYKARLKELKTVANTKDARGRKLLLRTAEDYEKLAAMAKKRLGKGD